MRGKCWSRSCLHCSLFQNILKTMKNPSVVTPYDVFVATSLQNFATVLISHSLKIFQQNKEFHYKNGVVINTSCSNQNSLCYKKPQTPSAFPSTVFEGAHLNMIYLWFTRNLIKLEQLRYTLCSQNGFKLVMHDFRFIRITNWFFGPTGHRQQGALDSIEFRWRRRLVFFL